MNNHDSPRNAMKRASEARKRRLVDLWAKAALGSVAYVRLPCEISDDERGGADVMGRYVPSRRQRFIFANGSEVLLSSAPQDERLRWYPEAKRQGGQA